MAPFGPNAEPFKPAPGPGVYAAPPPPAWQTSPAAERNFRNLAAPGLMLHSIGEPTDDEQLYLELINRARANPVAESLRFLAATDPRILQAYSAFEVDLELMLAQFALIPAAPPLSMERLLTQAARLHSEDMLLNTFQQHTGSNGSTTGQRARDQGYEWTQLGENIYAYAHSTWHGHSGFEVDWGGTPLTGGMQTPAGHRLTIHNPNFREVGIGVVWGNNGDYGPQLVTQKFGNRNGLTPYVTGVVYYDFNGNQFYDPGEGIGGVTVTVNGSQYYAVTANSGGYSVPVPGEGDYTVTFSTPGWDDIEMPGLVTGGANVKVDLIAPYESAIISGASRAGVGQEQVYTFLPVGGATLHQWKQNRLIPATRAEGAEDGLAEMTANTSPEYTPLSFDTRASGAASFRLAHPASVEQTLTWNRIFRPGPQSSLQFQSRLGWATTNQIAQVELSADSGQSWRVIWSQIGDSWEGEKTFTLRTVPLSAFAGQPVQIRFGYAFAGGGYFNQTVSGVGFYFDDILLVNAEELIEEKIAEAPTGLSFLFIPEATGTYLLSIRPIISGRFMPWGPAKEVQVQTSPVFPPQIQVRSIKRIRPQLQIDFAVQNGFDQLIYRVQTAPDSAGPWMNAESSIHSSEEEGEFRAILPMGDAPRRFYRILAE